METAVTRIHHRCAAVLDSVREEERQLERERELEEVSIPQLYYKESD